MSAELMRTPEDGQSYVEELPGSCVTHVELDSIFNVIGTPPWASIQVWGRCGEGERGGGGRGA